MRWMCRELYLTDEESRAGSSPKCLAQEPPKSMMRSFRLLPSHEISPRHHFQPQETARPRRQGSMLPFLTELHLLAPVLPPPSRCHTPSKGGLTHYSRKDFPWLQKKLLLSWLDDHFFPESSWATLSLHIIIFNGVVMKLLGDNLSGKQTVNCKMLTNISHNY